MQCLLFVVMVLYSLPRLTQWLSFHMLFVLFLLLIFLSFTPTLFYSLHIIRNNNNNNVCMWGYLPTTSPQHLPLLQPTIVPLATSFSTNSTLKIVNNGRCGFILTIFNTYQLFFSLSLPMCLCVSPKLVVTYYA